jgi:hypothetical protein
LWVTIKAKAAEAKLAAAEARAGDKEAEAASMASRMERLQRIQKQKRAEYEDMQVRPSPLGTLHPLYSV